MRLFTCTADSLVAVYDLKAVKVVGQIAAGKQADGMALVMRP